METTVLEQSLGTITEIGHMLDDKTYLSNFKILSLQFVYLQYWGGKEITLRNIRNPKYLEINQCTIK